MARSLTVFSQVACASLLVLSCTSSPGGTDGAGGVSSSGGSSASGGSSGTGASNSGGASSGGTGPGGTSSGGAGAGGPGSGGSAPDGTGGLGGESTTGGTDGSGGDSPGGGTGGASVTAYGPCETDQGTENNPACGEGEVCMDSTCFESCPTDVNDAVTYECPEVTSGTAPSNCSFALGRCILLCESHNGVPYSCPDGMICDLNTCVWP